MVTWFLWWQQAGKKWRMLVGVCCTEETSFRPAAVARIATFACLL
jgi:hypothetical protein